MPDLNLALLRWTNAEQDLRDATGILDYALRAPLGAPYQAAQANVVSVLRQDAATRRRDYDDLAGARHVPIAV